MSARVLDCGCLTGVYEKYSGEVVQIVDAVGDRCPRHQKGDELPRDDGAVGPAPSLTPSSPSVKR